MRFFYSNSRFFALVITLIAFLQTLTAQEGRLPTKQELDTKTALEMLYKSSAYAKTGGVNHIMTTGPEQDCNNAIIVCSSTYNQTTSYTGHGNIQEVNGTCLSSKETNSVWYVFTVQTTGIFSFLLNTPNDYDFALYDITTIGCAGVPTATPVRCNFSATYGNTGLTAAGASSVTPLSVGAGGAPTMPGYVVNAGRTFALVIDNFSANTSGYTLTFGTGGAAAVISDITAPLIASTALTSCSSNSLNVIFNESVLCNSISSNGSEFTITGPSGNVPVIGATGLACTGTSTTSMTYTASLGINTAGLPSGTYTVSVNQGSDLNTILDKCGNAMSTTVTSTFNYLAPISITASNSVICAGDPTTLTAVTNGNPVGQTISWSPGGATTNTIVVNPTQSITYIATASFGGCTKSASQVITVAQPPVVTVNPNNVSLCSGTTNIIASSTMNGAPCTNCNYVWTGSASQTDNNVVNSTITGAGVGSYSVTVSSNTGCAGNTAVSTVNILSPASPPSCDIIYVTPAGGGTGVTKSSPTTIQLALGMAACNAITIKMAVGDYSITAPLDITSFVTIEGGYNTAFTLKTSSTGTTGAFPNRGTRILRTTTSPEGAAGNQRLTAINVIAGSSYFRLQDLTIEVQNPADGSKISNYAVYLGTGCNNYNIVRCKINAGKGANGIAGVKGTDGTPGGDGDDGEVSGTSGGGFGGSGGTSAVANGIGGLGGNGGFFGQWYFDNNSNGIFDSPPDVAAAPNYYGTSGYGGGSNQAANYGVAGTGSQGQVSNSETSFGGCDNRGLPYYGGAATSAVVNGANGTNGTNGSAVPTYAGGYFAIGADGTSGTNGIDGSHGMGGGGGGYQNVSFDETGAGGGGGGGAGQAGTGGTGGTAAGAAFGIFSVSKGAGATITDCEISASAGTAASGGTVGIGGNGGGAGSGGAGCDGGAGGNGTAGGKGGNGGVGGNGAVGDFCLVCDLNGTTLSTIAHTNFSLTTQALITAENIACSNIDIDYTAASGAPNWTSFGTTATPASGVGTPFLNVQYSGLGRKTISLNSTVTTTVVTAVAAKSFTNTAASPNLGTSLCPTPINNTITLAGYTSTVASSGITIKVSTSGHNYFADVSMFLMAPNGQILGLTNNRGNNNGVSCSLNNVTFADAGAGIMGATCPAVGATFKPETTTYTDCSITSNITSFAAINAGAINPNGNWVLRMVDAVNNDGGAGIAVNGWTLNIPAVAQVTTSAAQNDPYTDFVNIQVTPPSTGSILASATALCPGTADFNSSVAGTSGLTYSWTTSPAATITSAGTSSTSITFPNATASTIIYTVSLNLTSQCCGSLTAVTKTIAVSPIPAAPTATVNSICNGGVATFTANTPAGSSFSWYNAASSGTLLATGNTYSANVSTPTTVYLQATNSGGCSSTITAVAVTPTTIPAPSVIPGISCDPGLVTVGINPVAGATDYSWFSDAGGTVLVQNGTSLNYSQNIPASGGSYVVYVQSNVPGCTPSSLASVTGTVNGTPIVSGESIMPNDTICENTPVTITLNPSGGSGAYTYSWSPVASTSVAIVQTPTISTSYNVIITSGTCSKQFNIPVIVVATPTANAGPTATITCINTSTVLSGSGGGTYSWSGPGITGGAATATPTVNLAGTYVLTVTVGACTSTNNVVVSQNTIAPTVTVGVTGTITCISNTVNLSAGPGAMNYTWTAPGTGTITSGQNAQTASGTGAGIYSVTVSNPINGCFANGTISPVVDNIPPSVSVTNAILTCANTSTVVTATPTAGVTYTWSGPGISVGTNAPTVTVTAVGNYTVDVMAPNGCVSSTVSNVTSDLTTPTVSAGPDQVLLCGASSVTLTGSATPVTSIPNWLGGVATPNSFTTTVSAAGVYTLEATHPVTGCISSTIVTVTSSTAIPQVTLNPITNSITCTNTIVTIGITCNDPVSYSWTGPGISGSTSSAVTTATIAGTYSVVITNTNTGCQASVFPIVQSNLTPVPASIAPSPSITCLVSSVTLSATPTGTNYAYTWSGAGAIMSGGTTENPVVNIGGDYTVTILNNDNGCTGTYTVNVPTYTTVPSVTLTPNSLMTTCANPTVALSASSSADPDATYQWTAPATGSLNTYTISNPVASGSGIFTVAVTNTVTGCISASAQNTVEVIPDAATPTVAVTAPSLTITCTNTTVTTSITSSDPTLTYTWNPSPITGGANPVFGTQGIYTVNISASNGCSLTTIVNVDVNNTIPTMSLSSGSNSGVLTCSLTSVNVTPTITPLTSDLTYTWTSSTGSGISTPVNQANATFTATGTYTLAITNTLTGCVATVDANSIFTITDNTVAPTGTITAISTNSTIGCGGSSSTVTLDATTSSTNTTISWSPGGQTTTPFSATTAGIYTLTVTDAVNTCTAIAEYTVTGNTTPPQNVDAGGSVGMPCGTATIALLGTTTSTTAVDYSWSGPGTITGSTTATPVVDSQGTFTLTVTDQANGCSSFTTVTVSQSNPTATITADPTEGLSPLPVTFSCTSTGATSWSWNFADGNAAGTQNASNTFTNSGVYTVTLTASSGTCTTTQTITITVNDGLTLEIPNVFTPNEDGVNDIFTIKSTGVKNISLQIFNRWGEKLYEFSGAKAAWDGLTGHGAKVPGGTYFYFVKATGFDDKEIEQHGSVNVFR